MQLIIPEEAPLDHDVDYEELARFEMAGGNMKGVVFRAAASAALRDEGTYGDTSIKCLYAYTI